MNRSKVVAAQLQALLDRHQLKISELATRVQKSTEIDPVTVRRVLKATAKSEPKPTTLRAIADAVGETIDRAFPESGELPTKDETIVIPEDQTVRHAAFALKVRDSAVPREMVEEALRFLRRLNREYQDQRNQKPGHAIPALSGNSHAFVDAINEPTALPLVDDGVETQRKKSPRRSMEDQPLTRKHERQPRKNRA